MSSAQLTVNIVSQEKQLDSLTVDGLTVPTSTGQITVLPKHIPLFTTLVTGELIFHHDKQKHESFAISKGFLDVGVDNQVTVIVDSVVHERDLNVQKAEAAIAQAEKILAETDVSRQERIQAEASLRQALLELKIAEKSKKKRI